MALIERCQMLFFFLTYLDMASIYHFGYHRQYSVQTVLFLHLNFFSKRLNRCSVKSGCLQWLSLLETVETLCFYHSSQAYSSSDPLEIVLERFELLDYGSEIKLGAQILFL